MQGSIDHLNQLAIVSSARKDDGIGRFGGTHRVAENAPRHGAIRHAREILPLEEQLRQELDGMRPRLLGRAGDAAPCTHRAFQHGQSQQHQRVRRVLGGIIVDDGAQVFVDRYYLLSCPRRFDIGQLR
jgi:hypothetical protein